MGISLSPRTLGNDVSVKTALASGVALILLCTPVDAEINGSTQLYCRDSTGVAQEFKGTTLGRLVHGIGTHLGMNLKTVTRSKIVFSDGPETMYYTTLLVPRGIVLESLHFRSKKFSDDEAGTNMCWHSFGFVN